MFIGRTVAEAETPILWPPDAKYRLTGKDPDTGKDWGWEEKGMTDWDGWMASPMQWTWDWVGSGSWWWTGELVVLQSMGSQRVRHDWETEVNWVMYLMQYILHTKWCHIVKEVSSMVCNQEIWVLVQSVIPTSCGILEKNAWASISLSENKKI